MEERGLLKTTPGNPLLPHAWVTQTHKFHQATEAAKGKNKPHFLAISEHISQLFHPPLPARDKQEAEKVLT